MNEELKAQHRAERKVMKAILAGDDEAFDKLAELFGADLIALDELELDMPVTELDFEPISVVIEREDPPKPDDK